MVKKVIVNSIIVILVIINIIVCFNVKNYILILNNCFNKNIILPPNLYIVICVIFSFLTILISILIKLVIKNKKDEIKGISFKTEDGTFGTANWMSNEEISSILGVVNVNEYKVKSK